MRGSGAGLLGSCAVPCGSERRRPLPGTGTGGQAACGRAARSTRATAGGPGALPRGAGGGAAALRGRVSTLPRRGQQLPPRALPRQGLRFWRLHLRLRSCTRRAAPAPLRSLTGHLRGLRRRLVRLRGEPLERAVAQLLLIDPSSAAQLVHATSTPAPWTSFSPGTSRSGAIAEAYWHINPTISKADKANCPPRKFSSRDGGSDQQMLESRVEEAQHSLFQCFVLRVVRAFLLEWCEVDDLPLDDMMAVNIVGHRNNTQASL